MDHTDQLYDINWDRFAIEQLFAQLGNNLVYTEDIGHLDNVDLFLAGEVTNRNRPLPMTLKQLKVADNLTIKATIHLMTELFDEEIFKCQMAQRNQLLIADINTEGHSHIDGWDHHRHIDINLSCNNGLSDSRQFNSNIFCHRFCCNPLLVTRGLGVEESKNLNKISDSSLIGPRIIIIDRQYSLFGILLFLLRQLRFRQQKSARCFNISRCNIAWAVVIRNKPPLGDNNQRQRQSEQQ